MERKKLTLNELDEIPYVNERGEPIPSKIIEREEQVDAQEFIPGYASVLELGGRYGLAAAVINNRLDDPNRHVVVEPDPTVQAALKANRDSHQCHYVVFEGVISRQPMYFNQFGFSSFCSRVPNDTPIPTVSLEELQKKHSIDTFTHLVADCEGGLIDFFEENKDFIATLEGVYFEQDTRYTMKVDYEPLKTFLTANSFQRRKSGFREYWERVKLDSTLAQYCHINATNTS